MKTWIKEPVGISIAVNDLERSVKTWADVYGIGPWRFFKYESAAVQDMEVDGKSTVEDICASAAVTELDGFEIKLLCPKNQNNGIARFLQKHGEGIFSVKYSVYDYSETHDYLTQEKGHAQLIKGKMQGTDFCYIDTYDGVWHIMEIERGPQSYPVEYYYPIDGNAPDAKAQFTKVFQIAFMVNDIKKTIVKMVDEYGIGPFILYDLKKEIIRDPFSLGKPTGFHLWAGMAYYGDLEYELIQPESDGHTVCDVALERHGDCLQHIGYCVPDYDEAVDFMIKRRGCEIALRGTLGEGDITHTFLYIDTEKDLSNMVELNDTHPEWRPGFSSVFDYPAKE